MEGVSNEAASFAGHQKLSNLCWVYDNNHITIDGHTSITYEDDVQTRFEGYQWNVTRVEDANNLDEIARGFDNFKEEQNRPTLIIVDSHIGYGAPNKQDTAEAHGEPLGDEEVRETKRFYGWPEDAQFLVPDGVQEHFAEVMGKRGAELSGKWKELFESYRGDEPEKAAHWEAMQRRELPEGWDADIPSFEADEKGTATRKASNKVENAVAAKVPWLVVGAADLTGSNSVEIEGGKPFEPESRDGRQLHYGIREHESAAISNGLSLSKMRPLWSTYLTFSDYARPAIRLSSLMELPVIHLFTHDSIGLGEDGPTHQPVEQLASLRAIPGLDVIRPADANEVAEAWRAAMDRHHQPVALVLTRQDVPILDRTKYASADGLRRGGYVLADPEGEPEVILIATGSEVALAVEAHEQLVADGVASRVVSLPCWELFDRQDDAYKDEVLPPSDHRSGFHRGGIYPWVGPLGRTPGKEDRNAHLRLLRTPEGLTDQVRLHAGQSGRDGQGGTRTMNPTQELHDLGQSLWLDNITRTMLDDGTEQGYIDDLNVTGQTSNPTIFDKAISGGDAYDEQITELREKGMEPEDIFFELALADVTRAAKMFEQIHKETDRMDGWVSLEVSPTLAYDTQGTVQQAADLHGRAEENNFIKIPGTPEGLPAIEESIYAGVPINVTLLMSTDQTMAAADAYMKGIERRIEDGLDPDVPSVLSLFISRWDVAVHDEVPDELKNTLGVAVGKATYKAWMEMRESDRWKGLEEKGARLQRLLFASTGTKDEKASDTLYIEAFAAPDTINTMPDKTLNAFADHGKVGDPLPADGGDCEQVFKAHQDAGIDTDALGLKLQKDGADAFVKSWNELLETIKSESERLAA